MPKQNLKVKENWRHWTPELTKIFLRSGPEGTSHPSRARVLSLLEGLSSVLDVGCGNGVMFEMIRKRRLDLDYLGIDVTENLLQVARQLFPADAHRVRGMSLYDLKKLRRKFDAVVCRHVLEHLPDYVPAVQYLYSRTRKKLILVFFYLLSLFLLVAGGTGSLSVISIIIPTTWENSLIIFQPSCRPCLARSDIHFQQGKSPGMPWADRQNVIYEVNRRPRKVP